MRVAVIENMRNIGLGALAAALDEAGAHIEWFRVWQDGVLPPDISGHDALVVLGGEQSALDDEAHPYLPELVQLTRRFGDAGKAVLGICLGSQILARAYGGDNILGSAREFGWHGIGVTEEGRADPLLSALGGEFTIFEWHADTFSLPAGAMRLARSPVAENQAFRIGRAVYGTQFHFEANSAVVAQWKAEFPDTIERIAPGWLESHAELAANHGGAADAAGLAIARAWVSLIEAAEIRMLSEASA